MVRRQLPPNLTFVNVRHHDAPELAPTNTRQYDDNLLESSQIDRMSMPEGLRAMEQLWDALARDAGEIPSPEWHRDVLAERRARAERGEAKFLTLDQLRSCLRGTEG
jgi:hypothetical protein